MAFRRSLESANRMEPPCGGQEAQAEARLPAKETGEREQQSSPNTLLQPGLRGRGRRAFHGIDGTRVPQYVVLFTACSSPVTAGRL